MLFIIHRVFSRLFIYYLLIIYRFIYLSIIYLSIYFVSTQYRISLPIPSSNV